jgi:hypothetical protein
MIRIELSAEGCGSVICAGRTMAQAIRIGAGMLDLVALALAGCGAPAARETPAADTGSTYFCEGPSWLVNSPPCVEGAACSLDMVDGGSTPGTCAVVR